MKKPTISEIIERKDALLFFVFFISGISLLGWLLGKTVFASVLSAYIPMAPSTGLLLVILSILFLRNKKSGKSVVHGPVRLAATVLVLLFCLSIVLDYFFKFSWDIEDSFVKSSEKLGSIAIGRMSPLTAMMFIFICIGIGGLRENSSVQNRYIAGIFSVLTFVVSSVLLIGYLYDAPLLYGGQTIPVALLSAVCFLLFSVTLLRSLHYRFWTFHLIKENKITLQLLRSLLPVVVGVVMLSVYTNNHISSQHLNPTLVSSIILLITILVLVLLITQISKTIGMQLLSAEKSLQESERRFKLAVQNAPYPIMIHTENGKVLSLSRSWEESTGYSLADIPTIADWIKRAFGERNMDMEKHIDTLYEMEGSRDEGEYIIRCKDSSERIWDFSSAFLGNFENEGRVVLSMAKDVTERKHIEMVLVQSEKELKRAQQITHMGSFVVDLKTSKVVWTDELYKIFGLDAAFPPPALDETQNLFSPESWNLLSGAIAHTTLTGNAYELELATAGEAGTGWVWARGEAILDADGKITHISGAMQDITERKKIEEEIRKAKEQAEKSNKELEILNATKDKFFSIIVHDLKSPFNSILGFSDLLVEQIRENNYAGIEKYADIIHLSSNRTMDLLMNLMEWSQSQTGRMEFAPEHFDLVDLIKETDLLLSGAMAQKSIGLFKNLPACAKVYADRKMIGTVLRNLVSNAIKFTYPEGRITVAVEEMDDTLQISVSDNGVGISKVNGEKLFRIDQSHSTVGTKNEKGTGLGLILCKEFVEKHGGEIWVNSELGKGCNFCFTIPRRKPE